MRSGFGIALDGRPTGISWKRKLLFACAVMAACLAALELTARLLGQRPYSQLERIENHLLADRDLGYRWEAGMQVRYMHVSPPSRIGTDQAGLRLTFWPFVSEANQVLCVGDSVTFCAEVNDEETWPSQLSRRLAAAGRPMRVLNAGVRGYSTLQARRMLDRLLEAHGEAKLAIYVYCENDLVENVNPIVYWPLQAPAGRWEAGRYKVLEVT